MVVEQTDLWITLGAGGSAPGGGSPDPVESALALVREARARIAAWIAVYPCFAESLAPLPAPAHAPEIISNMYRASAVMGVGPMATVAGAVAAHTAQGLLRFSPDCIVENGGDSMLYSTRERVVALLPDPANAAALGLRIAAEDFPLSLCSSSATIGHSLSFGRGELAVVRSRDPFLADAAATAFCNMLQGPEDAGRVAGEAAALAHTGIDGVFVQCGGSIGVWGAMELVAL